MAAQISEKFAGNGLATVVTDTKFEGILRPTTSNDTGRYDRTGFAVPLHMKISSGMFIGTRLPEYAQEEHWEQEQERFQRKHDRERENRERRERRKRARRLRQIQMLQLLKSPLQVLLLALLSSILFVLLALLALALVGWFTFIGLLVTVVAYLLLITMICADFAFLSFKGNPSVPARAPVLLASEAGRIKALACRLLRAHRLRRNGRTPLWRAGAAENRLR